MSQPPYEPNPGSYPPHRQPGGYGPPQQSGPQYGGGYPTGPQYPGQQHGGGQYGGPQYGGGYPGVPQQTGPHHGSYLETGQPGYGQPADLPPKKKSRAGRIVLIVLAVVVVLCLGGGAAVWFLAKDTVGEVVDASKTRLVEPETLGGRPKLTEPSLQSAVTQMKAEMQKDVPQATSTVGGFYGNLAKKDMVMIAGASGVIADPKKELEDAVTGLGSTLGVKQFKTVDAGPLGGDAKCGDGRADGIQVGVCAWADRGSLGMIVIYYKPAAALQSQFVAMRSQIEQKG